MHLMIFLGTDYTDFTDLLCSLFFFREIRVIRA